MLDIRIPSHHTSQKRFVEALRHTGDGCGDSGGGYAQQRRMDHEDGVAALVLHRALYSLDTQNKGTFSDATLAHRRRETEKGKWHNTEKVNYGGRERGREGGRERARDVRWERVEREGGRESFIKHHLQVHLRWGCRGQKHWILDNRVLWQMSLHRLQRLGGKCLEHTTVINKSVDSQHA